METVTLWFWKKIKPFVLERKIGKQRYNEPRWLYEKELSLPHSIAYLFRRSLSFFHAEGLVVY